MFIVHDPRCADYGSYLRPEQPARVVRSEAYLRETHPEWTWSLPTVEVTDDKLLIAHTRSLINRLEVSQDIDDDTPYFPGISDHARRAVAAALTASRHALAGKGPAFSLMRPPGHHATLNQSMGFCYLNSIAIAALDARDAGAKRVAVWDFDAHHGNGTEDILLGKEGVLFTSIHQSPCYPGTGLRDRDNCHNWPVPPRCPREKHVTAVRAAFDEIGAFQPDLCLVSAGFDAFSEDPITAMSLEAEDFAAFGAWLSEAPFPVAAVLEGGYSDQLPQLIESFLSAWNAR
jgi:acetoin utilization deacetylase AcuC-like enzyme